MQRCLILLYAPLLDWSGVISLCISIHGLFGTQINVIND